MREVRYAVVVEVLVSLEDGQEEPTLQAVVGSVMRQNSEAYDYSLLSVHDPIKVP